MKFEPVAGSDLTLMLSEAAATHGLDPVAVTVYVPAFLGALIVIEALPPALATAVPITVPFGEMLNVTVVPAQKPDTV